MKMLASIFALLFLLVAGVAAQDVMPTIPATRNISTIPQDSVPSECQAQCSSDTLFAVSNCTVVKCMCTNETSDAIKSCTDCLIGVSALDSTVQQAVFGSYDASCLSLGVTLKMQVSSDAVKLSLTTFGALLIGAAVGTLL